MSLERIGAAADVYRGDGHSEYGRSFTEFTNRYLDAVSPHTTIIIITGDARTNYRFPAVDRFRTLSDRARAVFWLNPEPERFYGIRATRRWATRPRGAVAQRKSVHCGSWSDSSNVPPSQPNEAFDLSDNAAVVDDVAVWVARPDWVNSS